MPIVKGSAAAFALSVLGVCSWALWPIGPVGATPAPVSAHVTRHSELDAGASSSLSPSQATASIVFNTVPPTHATVSWGKKRLGQIAPGEPLTVVRPRDSGPLDVVVRADGFLPVHTRAHTFSDGKILVKLTPLDQTATLLGYRVPLDAGTALPLDEVLSVDAGELWL